MEDPAFFPYLKAAAWWREQAYSDYSFCTLHSRNIRTGRGHESHSIQPLTITPEDAQAGNSCGLPKLAWQKWGDERTVFPLFSPLLCRPISRVCVYNVSIMPRMETPDIHDLQGCTNTAILLLMTKDL